MKKWIKQYREKRFKPYKFGHIRQVTVVTSFENLQIDWQTEGQYLKNWEDQWIDGPIDRQKDKHMHVNGNDNGQTDE